MVLHNSGLSSFTYCLLLIRRRALVALTARRSAVARRRLLQNLLRVIVVWEHWDLVMFCLSYKCVWYSECEVSPCLSRTYVPQLLGREGGAVCAGQRPVLVYIEGESALGKRAPRVRAPNSAITRNVPHYSQSSRHYVIQFSSECWLYNECRKARVSVSLQRLHYRSPPDNNYLHLYRNCEYCRLLFRIDLEPRSPIKGC